MHTKMYLGLSVPIALVESPGRSGPPKARLEPQVEPAEVQPPEPEGVVAGLVSPFEREARLVCPGS